MNKTSGFSGDPVGGRAAKRRSGASAQAHAERAGQRLDQHHLFCSGSPPDLPETLGRSLRARSGRRGHGRSDVRPPVP